MESLCDASCTGFSAKNLFTASPPAASTLSLPADSRTGCVSISHPIQISGGVHTMVHASAIYRTRMILVLWLSHSLSVISGRRSTTVSTIICGCLSSFSSWSFCFTYQHLGLWACFSSGSCDPSLKDYINFAKRYKQDKPRINLKLYRKRLQSLDFNVMKFEHAEFNRKAWFV